MKKSKSGFSGTAKTLPAGILKALSGLGVEREAVVHYAQTDINENGEYRTCYLVLSSSCLYVFTSEDDSDMEHYYKGYAATVMKERTDWACRQFDLAKINRLWLEMGVGCNVLVAELSDGTQGNAPSPNHEAPQENAPAPTHEAPQGHHGVCHVLTMCSNLHKSEVNAFIKLAMQLKNGGEYEIPKDNSDYCPKCGRMYPDDVRKMCPHCMDRRSIFTRILGYFMPYKLRFILLFVITLCMAAMNLAWPYLNGTILYDKILAKDEAFLHSIGIKNADFVTALLVLVLTMFAVKVTHLLLQILQGILTAQMVVGVVRDIKKDVFGTMGRLSISFYKNRQTGSLMTRVMSDADRIVEFFIDGAPYILIYGFTTIATLGVMFRINIPMALVTIATFPVLLGISLYLRPKIWIMFGKRHRAERALNSAINDNLTGARVVKSFGQEAKEIERFEAKNKLLRKQDMAITYRDNYFRFIYNLAQSIASIGAWIIGVYLLLEGKGGMEMGILLTFVGYVGELQGPMQFFSRLPNWWSDSMNSAQRIFEIIDAIPEVLEPEHPVLLGEMKGNISISGMTFGYDTNRPVLKDINLEIPAGKMYGIVGRSGAGKTTLVNLISRMYDVNEGSISIDGVNVKDLSFDELRKNVAMVSQDTYIFAGTVAENIAYANSKADKKEIIMAAKLAGAHEFIMRMADGYDTKIGAGGKTLSGGEKQRVSIARAILANPKILILDEATASVDTETERVIQKSLNYLVQGRTTISIAHRLSTLKDADYLVVIDNGEITERGTHAELTELKGTYFKLLELQTKALERHDEGTDN